VVEDQEGRLEDCLGIHGEIIGGFGRLDAAYETRILMTEVWNR
jgi:hypothetical protein